MLDIRAVRQEPAAVRAALARRDEAYGERLDALLAVDREHRQALAQVERLRSERNRLSQSVAVARREGRETDAREAIDRVKAMSDQMARLEATVAELAEAVRAHLLELPNLPHSSVPPGGEGDAVEVRRHVAPTLGRPAQRPENHWDIGQRLGILDFERASKLSGSRFVVYRGLGARLERALVNFMMDHHATRGYTEILPPVLVKEETLWGTRHLPKFRDDMFATTDARFLISTSEIPVTAYHGGEILPEESLPLRYVAFSSCFRSEAGAAGRDTRGLIRQHQFEKVELVTLCTPEASYDVLERMTRDAQSVLEALQLSHRVVALAVGDLGFTSAKTYDLEVWLPGSGAYREISSVSNVEAFQARSLGIRYRDGAGAVHHVHTLNGSGLAVGRTLAAILEQGLQEDGSVALPPALWPYMGGVREIAPQANAVPT
jgi:seryl-tRNA synthetase